jgi:hypothetical protein
LDKRDGDPVENPFETSLGIVMPSEIDWFVLEYYGVFEVALVACSITVVKQYSVPVSEVS